MAQSFDLIVLGTGSAASKPAHRCRAAGWTVAIVDELPFGGTCALRGCDPKKVLVGAAAALDRTRRLTGKGVSGGARIDWPALAEFKRTFVEETPARRESAFDEAGIATFHGHARFVDPTTIEVGGHTLSGGRIVIATGAMPAKLDIPGEEHLITSTEFLELAELPKRIVFVGGGFISFEFAHVAARAGAQVTIVHRDPRPLRGFDPDLVDLLVGATRELGIDVRLDERVEGIERANGELVVRASGEIRADLAVHGAGRVPNIDGLDLARANVSRERRGVVVDEHLQSVSNPAVYAAGDAAATRAPMLTPVAAIEGHTVASNLIDGNRHAADYRGVASVLFTTPPLARVGLSEADAKEAGLKFRVQHEETSWWYSTRRVGEATSGYKILIDEESDQILGAHLLGPEADEVINLFALAIRAGIGAGDLKRVPFAYPTVGSDIPYML